MLQLFLRSSQHLQYAYCIPNTDRESDTKQVHPIKMLEKESMTRPAGHAGRSQETWSPFLQGRRHTQQYDPSCSIPGFALRRRAHHGGNHLHPSPRRPVRPRCPRRLGVFGSALPRVLPVLSFQAQTSKHPRIRGPWVGLLR